MKRQFLLIPLLAIAMLTALLLTFNAYQPSRAVSLTQPQSEEKQNKHEGWQHDNAWNKKGSHNYAKGDHANGQAHEGKWSQMHTMTDTHSFSDTTSISSRMTISDVKALHEGKSDKSGRWHHAGPRNGHARHK